MTSILKVSEIQDPTNGNTALSVDSTGRVTQPALPAACFHYQGSNLAGAAIIPLNTQSVLQGGMTMSSNAITLPVTGLYHIGWYHLNNLNSSYAVIIIRINGVANTILQHGNQTQYKPANGNNTFSYNTIASLSANDTVDFYLSQGQIHGNADYNSMHVYLLG